MRLRTLTSGCRESRRQLSSNCCLKVCESGPSGENHDAPASVVVVDVPEEVC